MKKIITEFKQISLEKYKTYYIIDALYLTQIKNFLRNQNKKVTDLDKAIYEEVFPDNSYPFAKVTFEKEYIGYSDIIMVNYAEINLSFKHEYLLSDTGLLLIIEDFIFRNFIEIFDYDELTDSEIEILNENYWNTILKKFNDFSFALILKEGGGVYRVIANENK